MIANRDLLGYQDTEQVCFDELPDELILSVFSHLSLEELASVSKVCLRWRSIARDVALWEDASVSYDSASPSEFLNIIKFAPSLARVKIHHFQYITEEIMQAILNGCSSVKYLSFYPDLSIPVNLRLDILCHYQNSLTELNIYVDDSYMLHDSSKSLCEILSNMVNLRVLTLRGCISWQYLGDKPFIYGCQTLDALDVCEFYVGFNGYDKNNQDLNPLQNFVVLMVGHHLNTLKKLLLPFDLFKLPIAGSFSTFADQLSSSKIENIKLGEMCLTAGNYIQLLKVLHVGGAPRSDLDVLKDNCSRSMQQYSLVYSWISNTPQFVSVRELTLEHIFDDERNLISRLVKACRNLKCLTLFSCCHSSSQLSLIISQLPSLKTLNIHHEPWLRSSHLDLISVHLPNLELLNLQNNVLTGGILLYYRDNVQSKMPNLSLVSDWGIWNKNGGRPYLSKLVHCGFVDRTSSKSSEFNDPSKSFASHMPDEGDKIRMVLDAINDYEDED